MELYTTWDVVKFVGLFVIITGLAYAGMCWLFRGADLDGARDMGEAPEKLSQPDPSAEAGRTSQAWRANLLTELDVARHLARMTLRDRVTAWRAAMREAMASAPPVAGPRSAPSGWTIAESAALILAARQSTEQSTEPVTESTPGFAPEVPDEPVEDEPEPVEEEPVVVPAALGVETPPAPTPEPEVIPPFVIQGEPTEDAYTFGSLAAKYPVYEDDWRRTGFTGFLPRITDEPLEVQQARHDAAALLDEVTA